MSTEALRGEFVRVLRDRLTKVIESNPKVLLEHDGGPEGLKADLILATLYGMDGQVDAEWRIPRAEPYLFRPLMRRLTLAEPDPMADLNLPTARYELQSNWATMKLDWLHHRDMLPADVRPQQGDYLVAVALLRYRRRL